jgi:flagellar protein FlhE
MRKWLWILFFPLAAQAAGEGMAGQQHGVTLSNRGSRCLQPAVAF